MDIGCRDLRGPGQMHCRFEFSVVSVGYHFMAVVLEYFESVNSIIDVRVFGLHFVGFGVDSYARACKVEWLLRNSFT